MCILETLPAPLIQTAKVSDKWELERDAFYSLLPKLLVTHAGLFVAVHDRQVAFAGGSFVETARAAYSKIGYVPIFIGQVTTLPPPTARVESPRIIGGGPL